MRYAKDIMPRPISTSIKTGYRRQQINTPHGKQRHQYRRASTSSKRTLPQRLQLLTSRILRLLRHLCLNFINKFYKGEIFKMAEQILVSKIQLRNDLRANWLLNNPVLMQGEVGLETDTRLFKVGDGTKTWSELAYQKGQPAEVKTANPTATDYAYEIGQVWINTTEDKVFILVDNGENAAIWQRLVDADSIGTTAHALTMGTKKFDGSADVTLEAHDIGAITKTDYATAEGGVVVTSADVNGVAVDAVTGKMTVYRGE